MGCRRTRRLLARVARGSYKRVVDVQLAAGGREDRPTSIGYLPAYVVDDEGSIPERIEGLGIKQREFRQLVDTLVLRGYITWEIEGTASPRDAFFARLDRPE